VTSVLVYLRVVSYKRRKMKILIKVFKYL